MANKKGQEMSVATLVLVVIGIVILVLLILGFSMGWQNLWNKINILGPSSDISTVIQSCQLAASSGDKYAYCSEFKQVKISGETVYLNCQSNQVDTSLSSRLDCPKSIEDNAKAFCNSTAVSKWETTKVVSSAGVGSGTFKSCKDICASGCPA
ncbi:MAG: hypothetical protein QXS38_00155 [Candidatus Pacearchaeota archaeon]